MATSYDSVTRPGGGAAARRRRPRRAREADRRGGPQLARLVRQVHGRRGGRRGAAPVSGERRLRRDRPRRRLAGGALRRGARRGRPAGRGRRARADRRRVLLLGLHPVEVPAAPGRGGRRGARQAAASAEVDVEAALAWRDLHGLRLDRRRPGEVAGGQRDRAAARLRAARRAGGGRGRRHPPHGPPHRARQRRRAVRAAGARAAGARRRLGHARGDQHEGGAAPPAGARRRPGRGRAVAGRQPARRHGDGDRRRPAPARPRTGAARRGARRGPARRRDRDGARRQSDRGAPRRRRLRARRSTTGAELRGDRILVATGRRPRVEGIGLETIGVEADPHGVKVDDHLRVADGVWAIGDVNGAWPLTHVGKYEGEVVASNILGADRPVNYEAVPRVTYTDPAGGRGRRRRGRVQRHARC